MNPELHTLSNIRNKIIELSEKGVNKLDCNKLTPNERDIILKKPQDIIELLNIYKIKLINIPSEEISLKNLSSKYVGKFVKISCIIKEVGDVTPILKTAVFECKTCMRIHKVEQYHSKIYEPSSCPECGRQSFKLLREESSYQDKQVLKVTSTDIRKLFEVELTEDLCSWTDYYKNQSVTIVVIPSTKGTKNDGLKFHLFLYDIEINDSVEVFVDEDDIRNSLEYKKWRETVLNTQAECQCCGYKKRDHLVVHHMFGYKEYPALRTELDNGVVLCAFCHNKFHSIYGKRASPSSLINFIRKFGVR